MILATEFAFLTGAIILIVLGLTFLLARPGRRRPGMRSAAERLALATAGFGNGQRVSKGAGDSAGPESPASAQSEPLDGIFEDSTAERRIAARMREEEGFNIHAALLNCVDEGVIASDRDGAIRVWNHSAERLFEWPADQAIGRELTAVASAVTSDHPLRAVIARLAAGTSWTGEITVERSDATGVVVLVSTAPLRSQLGERDGMVCRARDISERKQAASALIEERRTLEVLNRAADLMNGQLDLKVLLQATTDVCVELACGQVGALFYRPKSGPDRSFELHALAGALRQPISQLARARAPVLATIPLGGSCTLRSDDISTDSRIDATTCLDSLPQTQLPLRSYLAVPLVLRSGEVIGGMFFGHEKRSRFTERVEKLIEGIASRAAIWIENARLFEAAQQEIEFRKRAEQWLNASEARFRDFAEVASDALWETDTEFRITSYAHNPANVLGVPLADVIGKTRWKIAKADVDAPEWKQHIDDHLARRTFHHFEFRVTDENGDVRWISSNGRPFFDAKGNFLGYRGTATNITARKNAEAKLNHSVRQQQAVATISQLALQQISVAQLSEVAAELIAKTLSADLVSILELSADKQVFRLRGGFGWPPAAGQPRAIPLAICRPLHEALNANDAVFFSRRDFNIVPNALDRSGSGVAVAMGDKADRLGVLAVCGGESRSFDKCDANFLQSVAFVLSAVAEQRKAEAVLRLRDRALEALDQGIMISDAGRLDNPLIYVNPAFQRLTGFSSDEAIGKNARFLQGPETDAETIEAIRSAVERGESFRGTILNYRKDASSFWNDLTISPVRDANGTTRHFVGVLSDVTERTELEAQLRQAQKMEAVGHLTGGIAHDFNNLLAVILGNSEILYEELSDPDLKATAQLVMETAEHGADLTQGLLAFGRRQALRPEAVNLGEAIATFSGVLRRTLGEQIRLDTFSMDASELALVDIGLFESAILNLAVNARDAMPDGGTLTIETATVQSPGEDVPAELPPGEYIKVSVRDTGIGMSSEVRNRVFEPFFTTKDVGKGSGLGLPMVYGFAKQSGGHVTIDSAPGMGTSVHLFLPQAPPRPQCKGPAPAEQYAAPQGCENILLVEDESEVRRFVAKQLSSLGYSVLEADDSAAALRTLSSDAKVDLLFSDLILPGGMTGLQLLERARQLRPNIKAVLTTGYTEEFADFEFAVSDPILKKPYKRQRLAETVRRALDARGS